MFIFNYQDYRIANVKLYEQIFNCTDSEELEKLLEQLDWLKNSYPEFEIRYLNEMGDLK